MAFKNAVISIGRKAKVGIGAKTQGTEINFKR